MLSLEDKVRSIKACEAWSSLGESAAVVLAERMNEERFAGGETVVSEGEEADRVFVIASGTVTVHVGGSDVNHRVLGPGDIWGEFGPFHEWQRTGTVMAKEESVLLSLSYPRFKAFMFEFPEVAYHLLGTVVRRLTERERKDYE